MVSLSAALLSASSKLARAIVRSVWAFARAVLILFISVIVRPSNSSAFVRMQSNISEVAMSAGTTTFPAESL